MKTNKFKKFLKGWGIVILLNLVVIIVTAICIGETFFWKEVPYEMQHITKDLTAYLIYYRSIIIAFMTAFLVGINVFFFASSRPAKKEDSSSNNDNNGNSDSNNKEEAQND